MTDRIEPTERMIQAAMKAGQETGLIGFSATAEVIARVMLKAALEAMPRHYDGPRYPLRVKGLHGEEKARFLGVTDRYAYFRVETEGGREITISANEILPTRRATR